MFSKPLYIILFFTMLTVISTWFESDYPDVPTVRALCLLIITVIAVGFELSDKLETIIAYLEEKETRTNR